MPLFTMRATDDDLQPWKDAASAAELSLSAWVRKTLDAACGLNRVVGGDDEAETPKATNFAAGLLPPIGGNPGRYKNLCPRCSRVNVPSCSACVKANQ